MELDVSLRRSGEEPWGFRLIGGTDFGMPLTVVKVVADSPAELAGLRNGDTVLSINSDGADSMTHEQSRRAVAAAGDCLDLKVVRGLYDPVLDDTEPLYELIDQTDQLTDPQDFDQPLHPTEVDTDLNIPRYIEQPGPLSVEDLLNQNLLEFQIPNDRNDTISRSLTASPFVPQLKPYRPFSTEPIAVPKLEDPIILNSDYKDVFDSFVDEELLPVTRFKLPISEQYDPDGTKLRVKSMKNGDVKNDLTVCELKIETTVKDRKYEVKDEKYEVKNEKYDVKDEKSEVKDSVMKEDMREQGMTKDEVTFLEKMQQEIDVEKIEMTASSIVDESIEKAVTVAEEIKNEIAVELNEISRNESVVEESTIIESKEKFEVVIEDKISKESATKEVEELVELLDKTSDEIIKGCQVKESHEHTDEVTTVDQKEESIAERKVSIKEFDETLTNTEAATTRDETRTSIDESSIIEDQSRRVVESKAKLGQKSTEKTSTSTSDKKYSTSKLLAEQRAYVIGLQTIPNIRGTAHSSYHYDLLLRTFFIHLTDVMVALSRFILAQPVLSKTSDGQTGTESRVRKDFTEQVQETVSVGKQDSKKQESYKEEVVKRDKVIQDAQIQDTQVQKQEKVAVKELAKLFSTDSQEVQQQETRKVVAKQERKSDFFNIQEQKRTEEKAVIKLKEETQQNKRYEEFNHVDMSDSLIEHTATKMLSGSKMAQMTEKKSEELMQKMEAVITEFESKSGGEDIDTVRERRSRSQSRAGSRAEGLIDEFGEEKIKVSEEQSSQRISELSSSTMSSSLNESTTTRRSKYETDYETVTSTGDNNTYVAIVEAHVYTNKDAIFDLSKTTAVQKVAIETKQATEVAKAAIETKSALQNETKQVSKIVDTKRAIVQEKKEEVKQAVEEIRAKNVSEVRKEDKIDIKKETVQEKKAVVVQKVVEHKKEDLQEKVKEVFVAQKEEKMELATVVAKKEDKAKAAEVAITKDVFKEKAKEILIVDDKIVNQTDEFKEKIKEAMIVDDTIVHKKEVEEEFKEVATTGNKKLEKKEIVIQEIIEPIIETQEIVLDQDYLVTEAQEEVSSATSERAGASEVVTAQLVAAAAKLAVDNEEIHKTAMKEMSKTAIKLTEEILVAKSLKEMHEEEKVQEIVAVKEEKVAVKEDISPKQSIVTESTIVTELVAKEKNKPAVSVAVKKEKKESKEDIVSVSKKEETQSVKESTFTIKRQENAEEKIQAVSVQDESAEFKVTQEKIIERESTKLDVDMSSHFESHIERSSFESQHIEQESTFVAKSEVKDLKLKLNTDLARQESKMSEENDIDTPTPATIPPTPLTDEYVFKLNIPLPKLSGPPPPRDCTPSDDEDEAQITKRGLVPVVESEIEEPTIFDPPLPTPPISPKSPGSPRSPTYTKPGLKGGAKTVPKNSVSISDCKHSDEDPHIVKKNLTPIAECKAELNKDPFLVNPGNIAFQKVKLVKENEDPQIVKKSFQSDGVTALQEPKKTNVEDGEDSHIVIRATFPLVNAETTNHTAPNPSTPNPFTIFSPPKSTISVRSPKFPVYMKPGLRGGALGFKVYPGAPSPSKSPVYSKPGLKGGADRNYTKEEILEIERKSSLLASAIDETIKSIEEYKEEVGIKQEITSETTTNGVMYNGYAKVVETKIFDNNLDAKMTTEDITKEDDYEEKKTVKFDDKIVVAELKTDTVSDLETKSGLVEDKMTLIDSKTDANLFHEVLLANIEDNIKVENGQAGFDAPIEPKIEVAANDIVNFTPVIKLEKETKQEEVIENNSDPLEGYRPVHFDPEELLNAQRERRALGVRIPQLTASQERELYKTASGELIGTKQGIVDGLKQAVVDPDAAKELGKPGISEEKIAELISGESEMLREAHVMGLSRVLKTHMNKDVDSSVDFNKLKPIVESLRDSEVLKALNEEMLKAHEEMKKQEETKWTTFLQKPKRPVPKTKFGYCPEEEEKAVPYKVKIVKQPKPKVAPDYKPKHFDTGLLPWEERALREPTPPPVPQEDPILIPEEPPEILEAVDPLPESEVPDLEDSGIPLPPPEVKLPTPPPEEEKEEEEPEELDLEEVVEETEKIIEESLAEEMEQTNLAEQLMMSVQNMVDPNAPLEQQLSQMRAQLAALAQLPGVIQQSLEIVTKQLSQLSQLEASQAQTAQEKVIQFEERPVEIVEEAEQVTENGTTTIEEVPQDEPTVEVTTPAVEQSLTAEELERMRQEEETMLEEQRRVEKMKKEAMEQARLEHESRQVKQHSTPRVGKPKPVFGPPPQERPLVLPGGRRWRTPKDVYNDQFIAETLQAQAEIIAGKAKGLSYESVLLPYDERINFMKYEKPPVSLDHLKHSDVYKMIHSMDQTPLKRVDLLTPVMAEADYREKCRSMTPCPERLAQQVQP